MTEDWGMKTVQIGMVVMGFIAIWIVFAISVDASPLPLLGQCEYYAAYHGTPSADNKPYGEWYFKGDTKVKYCDPDT